MTSQTAFDLAKRKARFGHSNWIVYVDRAGQWQALRLTRSSLKAALLAAGCSGRFHLIAASTGIGHVQNWALGCLLFRNARHLLAA